MNDNDWVGWFRANRKSAWRPVCSAPTETECFRALVDQMHRMAGDWIVLKRHERPRGRVDASAREFPVSN